MTIWSKISGSALSLGGPLASLMEWLKGKGPGSQDPERSVAFTVGVIALGAKMAKADGIVTEAEIAAFREVFQVDADEMANVARVFNLAKQDVAGFETYAGQLARLFADQPEVLEDVMDGLFHIAKAEGRVTESEAFVPQGGRRDLRAGPALPLHQGAPHRGSRGRSLCHPRHRAVRRRCRGAPPLPPPGEGKPSRPPHRGRAAAGDGEDRHRAPRQHQCRLGRHRHGTRPLRRYRFVASPNSGERTGSGAPDMLIMHYTGMASAEAACRWLCDPASQVSCHYLVDDQGAVTQMVDEERRAWHAGVSSWEGMSDINSRSIGIEVHNPGPLSGYPDFPPAQMAAVADLARDIVARHAIQPEHVLAHSDVAPGRKIDPGEKFDWKGLASAGVGLWVEPPGMADDEVLKPGDAGSAVSALQTALARFGYGIAVSGSYDDATRIVVTALQRHFRPGRIDGIADAGTQTILSALLKACGKGQEFS